MDQLETLKQKTFSPDKLISAWASVFTHMDFWLTFTWCPSKRMSVQRALDEVRKYVRVRLCNRYVDPSGNRIKNYAGIEACVVAAPYPTNPHRPHVHAMMRHLYGELPAPESIEAGWGDWSGYSSPEACVVKPVFDAEGLLTYMMHHPNVEMDAWRIELPKMKKKTTADSREAIGKQILDDDVKRLIWLAR